jgi:hypothetical protein
MAVGGDLALPEVEGERPLTLRLTNAYVDRLLQVAEHDAIVAAAFNDVADLLAPPRNIMRPQVLWRVLRGPRQRMPAATVDPPANSVQRSAIVDAMTARATRLRSGAGTESDTRAEAQCAERPG